MNITLNNIRPVSIAQEVIAQASCIQKAASKGIKPLEKDVVELGKGVKRALKEKISYSEQEQLLKITSDIGKALREKAKQARNSVDNKISTEFTKTFSLLAKKVNYPLMKSLLGQKKRVFI